MADEEKNEPRPNRFDKLQDLLKGSSAKGFTWEAKAMPEEDHGSVVLRSHYWGLRRIFDGWRMDGAKPATLDEIKAHYKALSQRMGYPIQATEGTINQAAYRLMGANRMEEAIALFRHNVEQFPASANVHDSLGEALEQAKRLEEAHASYARAAEQALKSGDPLLETFQRNRDRMAAAMKPKP